MKAREAYDQLRPAAWAATPVARRLALLEQVQQRMLRYADDLAAADGRMKNQFVGEAVYSDGINVNSTIGLIGGAVSATIELYRAISRGAMPKPRTVTDLGDGTYDVEVFPLATKKRPFDSLMGANARFVVRPTWTNLARMTGTAVRANFAGKDF